MNNLQKLIELYKLFNDGKDPRIKDPMSDSHKEFKNSDIRYHEFQGRINNICAAITPDLFARADNYQSKGKIEFSYFARHHPDHSSYDCTSKTIKCSEDKTVEQLKKDIDRRIFGDKDLIEKVEAENKSVAAKIEKYEKQRSDMLKLFPEPIDSKVDQFAYGNRTSLNLQKNGSIIISAHAQYFYFDDAGEAKQYFEELQTVYDKYKNH